MRHQIAVILPAHNEASTVAQTIADFHRHLPQALICVIDNQSNDETRELARQALGRLGRLGLLLDEPRIGKGHAVRKGLQSVDADFYILADADLTYPARQAHELLAPLQLGKADMVVGDRLSEGRYQAANQRPGHNLGNQIILFLVNFLFTSRLSDILSGYRALSRRFVQNYPILVAGFELETDMTLHALHRQFSIREIPIDYQDRPQGSYSKLKTVRDGARILLAIVRIFRQYRPLGFFSGLSLVALMMAAVLFVLIADQTLWVAIAVGLAVSGIAFLLTGFVLEALLKMDQLNFARDLQLQSFAPTHSKLQIDVQDAPTRALQLL